MSDTDLRDCRRCRVASWSSRLRAGDGGSAGDGVGDGVGDMPAGATDAVLGECIGAQAVDIHGVKNLSADEDRDGEGDGGAVPGEDADVATGDIHGDHM